MKKSILGSLLLIASLAQADIYDDYKLLAESILMNSEKIDQLHMKHTQSLSEIARKFGAAQGAVNECDINDYQAQIDELKKEIDLLKKPSLMSDDLREQLKSKLKE
jgi:predicted DNA-binding protein YlxM (UPF0122 family)